MRDLYFLEKIPLFPESFVITHKFLYNDFIARCLLVPGTYE